MNTQPFVSLIFLGDDKKFPLNRSNNVKDIQIVALQLPLLGTKYQNASIIISNQAVKTEIKWKKGYTTETLSLKCTMPSLIELYYPIRGEPIEKPKGPQIGIARCKGLSAICYLNHLPFYSSSFSRFQIFHH